MTASGWLAVAVAVALIAGPATSATRLETLAGSGRLGEPAAATTVSMARRRRWHRIAPAALGCAVAVVAVIAVIGGAALAIAAAALCSTSWVAARDAVHRRAAQARAAQLRSALRVLVGELQAGARPAAALAAAAETGSLHGATFGAAARAAADGADAAAVLVANPATRTTGLAWRLGEAVGSELAGVLSRVEHDLAASAEQRRSAAVALAGPQASAALLAALPLLGMALGAAMGAQPWAVLVGMPAGRMLACAGVLLDVAGVLWMRRILNRAQRP